MDLALSNLYKTLINVASGEQELSADVFLSTKSLEDKSRIDGMLEKYLNTNDPRHLDTVIHFLERKLSIAVKDEDILPAMTKDSLEKKAPLDLVIVFDHLRSAWNIGNMIRTAEAFLAKEVWLYGYTVGLEHPKVAKASLGAENHIAVKDYSDEMLEEYREQGYKIYGVETIETAARLQSLKFNKKAILIFGNERFGLSKAMQQNVDEYIYIPMHSFKRSINVGNSLAVCMYEFMRQNGEF